MMNEAATDETRAALAGRLEALVIRNRNIELLRSKLKDYIERENPEQFKPDTVIKDVVYLLGISIDPKFAFANGFDDFKKEVERALGA